MTDDLGDVIKPVRVTLLDEDEVHDSKHDNALNEMDDVQRQITELWEAVVSLRKDIEKFCCDFTLMANQSDENE